MRMTRIELPVIRMSRLTRNKTYKHYVFINDDDFKDTHILAPEEADALGLPPNFNGNLHISITKPVDEHNWKTVIVETVDDSFPCLELFTWNNSDKMYSCCPLFAQIIQELGFKYLEAAEENVGKTQTLWVKVTDIVVHPTTDEVVQSEKTYVPNSSAFNIVSELENEKENSND